MVLDFNLYDIHIHIWDPIGPNMQSVKFSAGILYSQNLNTKNHFDCCIIIVHYVYADE